MLELASTTAKTPQNMASALFAYKDDQINHI